jgi:hypothetical protein
MPSLPESRLADTGLYDVFGPPNHALSWFSRPAAAAMPTLVAVPQAQSIVSRSPTKPADAREATSSAAIMESGPTNGVSPRPFPVACALSARTAGQADR